MTSAFNLPSIFFGIYLIVPLILGCSLVFGIHIPRNTLTKAQHLAGWLFIMDAIYLIVRTILLAKPSINHEIFRYIFFTLDSIVITYFTYIPYTVITERYPKRWSYLIGLLPLATLPLLFHTHTMELAAWSHVVPFGAGIYVLIRSVKDIKANDTQLKERYSNPERYSKSWLIQILVFFLLVTVVSCLRYLIHGVVWFNITASLLWSVLMITLYIFLVKQKPTGIFAESKGKTTTTTTTTTTNNEAIEKALQTVCVDGKLYLKGDITIDALARECGTNRTYLSSYLHEQLHQSFYDYINTLRIQEVEQLLPHSKMSQETIALRCGFNSARTMRSAYLKLRGKELARPEKTKN